MEELKLYCPATGELTDTSEYEWDDEVTDDTYQLGGQELTGFSDLIQEALKKEMDFPEATDRGLMEYYGWDNSVNEKVRSMTVTVEELGGRLYGVGICQVDGTLNREELADLKEYFSGQMSDGFGEGFEQRPIRTSLGELYVHLWQFKDYFVRTGQEMEVMRRICALALRLRWMCRSRQRHGRFSPLTRPVSVWRRSLT